jgi:hypothetical protein
MLPKIIPTQDPILIYRERMERMKLVSIAPLIFIIGLSLIYCPVLYIDKMLVFDFKKIINGLSLSFLWFIVTGFLIRQQKVKVFLKNASTTFRFFFDLPILIISLLWIIYCYYAVDVFNYPFFVTFYVLSVYSASKMITIPIYSLATNIIGILLILLFTQYEFNFFTTKDILENFSALYIGLYFLEIQLVFVKIINGIMKLIKYIFSTLLEEP